MAGKARTKDDFFIPGFDDGGGDVTIDPPPDPNQIPQTPPVFGNDGGPGVDVGADPSGGTSSAPFDSAAFARAMQQALGLSNAQGGMNPLAWLSVLGPLLGGILSNRATSRATDQMLQANTNATNFLQGQMGTAGAAFNPFIAGGQGAVAKLQGMPPSNLAGSFRPLGSGRALAPPGAASLASILNGTAGGH